MSNFQYFGTALNVSLIFLREIYLQVELFEHILKIDKRT